MTSFYCDTLFFNYIWDDLILGDDYAFVYLFYVMVYGFLMHMILHDDYDMYLSLWLWSYDDMYLHDVMIMVLCSEYDNLSLWYLWCMIPRCIHVLSWFSYDLWLPIWMCVCMDIWSFLMIYYIIWWMWLIWWIIIN